MMYGLRNTVRTVAIVLVGTFVALGAGPAAPTQAGQEDITEVISHKSFEATDAALRNGLKAAGFLIVGNYNYQQLQQLAGRTVAPAKGYSYLRPDLGTPIFTNDPRAALEIPLKVVVITVGGKVVVRYRKAEVLFASYRGLGDLARKLDTITGDIVKNATQ